jgi:hypothetical protein
MQAIGKLLVSMVVTVSICTSLPPQCASAAPEPKLEFFQPGDSSRIGSALYDETEVSIVKERLGKTALKWNLLTSKIDGAIRKGQRQVAKDQISNYFFQMKADMRQLSKLACNGDIYVRQKDGGEANFDYNR